MRLGGRRRVGVVAAALALVAAPAFGGAGASAYQHGPDAVGWWWSARRAVAPVVVPAPPDVPDGGMYVAQDPTGPSAVSAVRISVGNDVVAPTVRLVLHLVNTRGTPALDACPAAAPWTEVAGGDVWENRPTAECDSGKVTGVVASDGSTITFDVGGLVRRGTLDLVILPSAGAVFTTGVAKPGPDAFEVDAPMAGGVASSDTAPAAVAGDAVSTPVESAGALPAAVASQSETAGEPVRAAAPSADAPATALGAVAGPSRRPSPLGHAGRAAALALLAGVGGLASLLRRLPDPVVTRLGAVGRLSHHGDGEDLPNPALRPSGTGGIGRFARARVGAPPPL